MVIFILNKTQNTNLHIRIYTHIYIYMFFILFILNMKNYFVTEICPQLNIIIARFTRTFPVGTSWSNDVETTLYQR